ncbi:hypothetical protein MES5069_650011 [Mesorhizobium escarrei]|uniref:Uncharacterized protein n=1 Tax=Mesorhizobium escarrei TaxID=666018 RepID=A0ABM9EF84_9HYPH|nr:hypothetical protein MES5069_650011 [Mesorhizobium escarrei]
MEQLTQMKVRRTDEGLSRSMLRLTYVNLRIASYN